MKVISLWQPHAALMAIGAKAFETRDWHTGYRGALAIHATKGYPTRADTWASMALFDEEPFASVLAAAGYERFDQLERGAILSVGVLVSCNPTEWLVQRRPDQTCHISDQERAFGNYDPQRFAFEVRDMVRLITPVPVAGMQKLWTPTTAIDEAVQRAVPEQLRGHR